MSKEERAIELIDMIRNWPKSYEEIMLPQIMGAVEAFSQGMDWKVIQDYYKYLQYVDGKITKENLPEKVIDIEYLIRKEKKDLPEYDIEDMKRHKRMN